MSKAAHIKTAFAGTMPQNPRHAAEIERRIAICGVCPHAKYNATIPGSTGQLIHQYRCTQCTCTLFKRIMALSNHCPLGNWGEPEEED